MFFIRYLPDPTRELYRNAIFHQLTIKINFPRLMERVCSCCMRAMESQSVNLH